MVPAHSSIEALGGASVSAASPEAASVCGRGVSWGGLVGSAAEASVVLGLSVGSGVGSAVGTGLGSGVGSAVGSGVGSAVGTGLGSAVGSGVGSAVGTGLGSGVGSAVGSAVGTGLGSGVGSAVGSGVGSAVGSGVGSAVGSGVGSGVGSAVGSGVGSAVGSAVGTGLDSGGTDGIDETDGPGVTLGSGDTSGDGPSLPATLEPSWVGSAPPVPGSTWAADPSLATLSPELPSGDAWCVGVGRWVGVGCAVGSGDLDGVGEADGAEDGAWDCPGPMGVGEGERKSRPPTDPSTSTMSAAVANMSASRGGCHQDVAGRVSCETRAWMSEARSGRGSTRVEVR